MTTSVLFVCLGNICRSPLAEGVFLHQVQGRGLNDRFRADSAGTSAYHVGETPDPRSIEVAARHGIRLPSKARKVRAGDFEAFDVIVPMDTANRRDLLARCPDPLAEKVRLLREFDPDGPGDVPDPYYGGPGGFDTVFAMVDRSCARLLDALLDGSL